MKKIIIIPLLLLPFVIYSQQKEIEEIRLQKKQLTEIDGLFKKKGREDKKILVELIDDFERSAINIDGSLVADFKLKKRELISILRKQIEESAPSEWSYSDKYKTAFEKLIQALYSVTSNIKFYTLNKNLDTAVSKIKTTRLSIDSNKKAIDTSISKLDSSNKRLQSIEGELRRITQENQEVDSILKLSLTRLEYLTDSLDDIQNHLILVEQAVSNNNTSIDGLGDQLKSNTDAIEKLSSKQRYLDASIGLNNFKSDSSSLTIASIGVYSLSEEEWGGGAAILIGSNPFSTSNIGVSVFGVRAQDNLHLKLGVDLYKKPPSVKNDAKPLNAFFGASYQFTNSFLGGIRLSTLGIGLNFSFLL